jgi:hypothetical protein
LAYHQPQNTKNGEKGSLIDNTTDILGTGMLLMENPAKHENKHHKLTVFPSKLAITAHYSFITMTQCPHAKRVIRGSSRTTKLAEISKHKLNS